MRAKRRAAEVASARSNCQVLMKCCHRSVPVGSGSDRLTLAVLRGPGPGRTRLRFALFRSPSPGTDLRDSRPPTTSEPQSSRLWTIKTSRLSEVRCLHPHECSSDGFNVAQASSPVVFFDPDHGRDGRATNRAAGVSTQAPSLLPLSIPGLFPGYLRFNFPVSSNMSSSPFASSLCM